MASRHLITLSRHLTTTTTTTVFRRTLTSSTTTIPHFSLLRNLSSAVRVPLSPRVCSTPSRSFASRNDNMNDNNQNSSNRPPKETILLDGCDFEHWLVVTDPPPEDWTRDQIIDYYIKTLAEVVGSEEEARMKIYSVSTRHYFAFGALISEELSNKLKDMEKIRWVLPDSYLDVRNKDYGGEPFIDGQAVPYDPKYHEEWVRNNQKANERNNRSDRPRNNDRSRNFERRQRTQNFPNAPGGNTGGPPNQYNGPPNHAPHAPNMPQRNAGYQQNNAPSYQQNMPRNNAPGYQQNMPPNSAPFNQQNIPPNNVGYQQNMPPNNQGFTHNRPPPNNMGGNYGVQGNPGYSNNNAPNYQADGSVPHQNNAQVGNQQNYSPNAGYQSQNVPGRDMP